MLVLLAIMIEVNLSYRSFWSPPPPTEIAAAQYSMVMLRIPFPLLLAIPTVWRIVPNRSLRFLTIGLMIAVADITLNLFFNASVLLSLPHDAYRH